MAEFGWAFIGGGAITEAQGVTGSVLLKKGEKQISGSSNLTFNTSSNQLDIIGSLSASSNISASAFYGDGANITNVVMTPAGANTQLQYNNNGSFGASSNLTYNGSTLTLSGNLEVSGSVYANELVTNVTSKNVVNISATGSTQFGDSSDDIHTFVGSITGSKMSLTGLASGTAASTKFVALDSSNNLILTSSGAGSGGTLGAADDGDYTDGLFSDFTTNTTVGTAVDKMNEVLKILAPSPAPSLSRVNYETSNGITAKLSFGSSYPVTAYTSSGTAGGFSAIDRGGAYAAGTSGNNYRLGIYDGTQDINGLLNFHLSASVANSQVAYASSSFGNAETGTLKLELNGTVIHSVSLSGLAGAGNPATGSGTSLNGNSSGFTNVSVTASSFDGNGAEWYIFKHRTAKFKVDTVDQKVGWNYARIIHTVGATDSATNYVEWINDPSGAVNDLSVSNSRIENISLVGSKYLSGVQYNTDVTANYKVDINNLYRNVYASSGTPVSFTVANSSTPSAQSVPDIGGSENNTKTLGITASLDYNGNSMINAAMTANVTVTHPFKNTISNQGSATTGNGFLIDNRTLASTSLLEKFHDETYRITSGSYNAQSDVVFGAATWNSQTHMTGSNVNGHQDGLLCFDQKLYSPIDGDVPNGGNFSGISNVESGQPDMSSASGTRTFYRKIQNTSGASKHDMKIISTKNSTDYSNLSLNTSRVHVFIKIPGATGWMDISQNFTYNNSSDGSGALIGGASNSTGTGDNTHNITFGTLTVANSEYVTIKIVADASWAGYISQLQFVFGASAETPSSAPSLDDIDADITGTAAKLSFGSSNAIVGYNNVQGSGLGSMSNIDSNANYTVSGDRRGIFTSKATFTGTLNEDVSVSGNNYPNDSFYNGYAGSLVLEVNGSEVHTTTIGSSLGAISSNFNGNSSGFDLSSVSFSTTSDNVPRYLKPYRTGDYQIGAGDQRDGWNYARVIHRVGDTDTTTNYVEWIVDPSGSVNDMAASSVVLSDFNHSDVYYQSGIKYFASRPSGSFTYAAANVYRNTYSNLSNAIRFSTTTNCSISNIRVSGSGINTYNAAVNQAALPALNNSADCEEQSIQVTGTVLFDSLTSISGGLGLFTAYNVSVNSGVNHPFKSDIGTSTLSKNYFMVYSGSIGSTNLNTNEYFNNEAYRIVSGNYVSQSNTTASANSWDSQKSVNSPFVYGDHADGMVTINGYAISPFKIGNAGDTRNSSDGGSLQSPSGNPNYSTLSKDTRTYYRYFKNQTGLSKATFSIKLYGDATMVAKSGAFYTGSLGANKNINVELKVPFDPDFTGLDNTSTAWADCVKPYSNGVQPTSDGVGIYNGGGSGLDQTVDADGASVALQLQQTQVRNNQYFVIKISAHKDWTGYLSRVEIVY